MPEQRIDPVLVEKVAAVLKARSGGHFEAVRDQADEKFRGDAEAVIDELGLKEERMDRMAGAPDQPWVPERRLVGPWMPVNPEKEEN